MNPDWLQYCDSNPTTLKIPKLLAFTIPKALLASILKLLINTN